VGREPLQWNHELLAIPDENGDEVIVGEFRFDGRGDLQSFAAKRLDVTNGKASTLSVGAPPNAVRWLFDPKGETRVVETHKGGIVTIYWRAPGRDDWAELAHFDHLSWAFTPRYVDADGNFFVTSGQGSGGTSVFKRFDFKAGRPEANVLASASGFDFSGSLIIDRDSGAALGVRNETDAETAVWFSQRMKALQRPVDTKLPRRINPIGCGRCARPDAVILVKSFSDQDPGEVPDLPSAERALDTARTGAQGHRPAPDGDARLAPHQGARWPRPAGVDHDAECAVDLARTRGRPRARRTVRARWPLAVGRARAVPRFALLPRHRARVPRQPGVWRRALQGGLEAMGAGDAGRRRRRRAVGDRQGMGRRQEGLHRRCELRRLRDADGPCPAPGSLPRRSGVGRGDGLAVAVRPRRGQRSRRRVQEVRPSGAAWRPREGRCGAGRGGAGRTGRAYQGAGCWRLARSTAAFPSTTRHECAMPCARRGRSRSGLPMRARGMAGCASRTASISRSGSRTSSPETSSDPARPMGAPDASRCRRGQPIGGLPR